MGSMPKLLAQLVHHRLHAEGSLRGARGAVGGGLRLVDHYVVAVDLTVLHVVAGEAAGKGLHHRRAGVGSGVHRNFELHGGQMAVVLCPHLDLHPRAGGRAGRLKHLGAGHVLLHRSARLPGQDGSDGVEICGNLAAEAAANLHGRDLDPGHRQLQHVGGGGPHRESALGAGPDADLPVGVPHSGGVVRLDVALVHRRGGVLALDDNVGLGEALLHVAFLVTEMGCYVAGLIGYLAHGRSPQLLVQQWRAVLHRLAHVYDSRKHLVINLNQRDGRLGNVGVDGGDGGHRVALEQRLVAGQHVIGGELETAIVAAQFLFGQGGEGQVFCGYDGPDPGQDLSLAGVYGADAGVGMRTAQHLAVEQAVQPDVRAVLGAPGHLIYAVGTDRALADDVVFHFGENLIR